jgi:hypothetical protein
MNIINDIAEIDTPLVQRCVSGWQTSRESGERCGHRLSQNASKPPKKRYTYKDKYIEQTASVFSAIVHVYTTRLSKT